MKEQCESHPYVVCAEPGSMCVSVYLVAFGGFVWLWEREADVSTSSH